MFPAPRGTSSLANRPLPRQLGPLIVMPSFARRLLAALLVALHATVMLCGPCFHGLPGCGHGSGLSHDAGGEKVRDPIKSAHPQPDDCLVCHFLSHAQLPVDAACIPAVLHVCALRPETPPDPVSATCPRSTSPRAPPGITANLA